MFDYWVTQVAAGTGKIAYLDQPTILYRQHGANVVGAMPKGKASLWHKAKRLLLGKETMFVLVAFSHHAAVLSKRYADRLGLRANRQAQVLAGIWSRSRWLRFGALWRAGVRKPTFISGAGLFLLLLRNPPKDFND